MWLSLWELGGKDEEDQQMKYNCKQKDEKSKEQRDVTRKSRWDSIKSKENRRQEKEEQLLKSSSIGEVEYINFF